MKSRCGVAVVLLAALVALTGRGAGQESRAGTRQDGSPGPVTYDIFNVGGYPGDTIYTVGLDAQGGVAGGLQNSDGGNTMGFYRHPDGGIDVFGTGDPGMQVVGINAGGTIIGNYYTGDYIGFVRDPGGAITEFSVAGEALTEPSGINAAGEIVGVATSADNIRQLFLRDISGNLTTFVPPKPGPDWRIGNLTPPVINSRGDIAGSVVAVKGKTESRYGYMRSPGGHFTVFAFPSGANSLIVTAIGDGGQTAGEYFETDKYGGGEDFVGGFVRDVEGNYSMFAIPGASGTGPVGIDHQGTVVGTYSFATTSQNAYGFYRLQDGTLKTFMPPGSGSNISLGGVNAAGAITGTFVDGASVLGFIRLAQ